MHHPARWYYKLVNAAVTDAPRMIGRSTVPDWKNKLFFGDNLDILRRHIPDSSVDLVYLDPSFNSVGADLQVGPIEVKRFECFQDGKELKGFNALATKANTLTP